MRTAVILHGACDRHEYYEMDFPSPSNAHWIPWLQQKFLRAGILCQALELPTPFAPNYDEWANIFNLARIADDSIVVAHSLGSCFILRWLRDHPDAKLAKLVLVAPYLDPYKKYGNFLQGDISVDLKTRIGDFHILYSTDEPVDGVSESKDRLITLYPDIILHTYKDKQHFCLSDTGPAFEDLWVIAKP